MSECSCQVIYFVKAIVNINMDMFLWLGDSTVMLDSFLHDVCLPLLPIKREGFCFSDL
jgi:hypothetical protein